MEIYIIKDGVQQGPYTLEELTAQANNLGLTHDTPVWYQGLTDWSTLREAEATQELATIIMESMVVKENTTPPPVPAQFAHTTPPPVGGNNGDVPPMPDNNLVWAIISMVCCCLPFGIVALVYATQVSSKYYAGDYEGAYKSAEKAKNWSLIAVGSGIVWGILCGIAQVAMGVLSEL